MLLPHETSKTARRLGLVVPVFIVIIIVSIEIFVLLLGAATVKATAG